jgi:hypothetical protein
VDWAGVENWTFRHVFTMPDRLDGQTTRERLAVRPMLGLATALGPLVSGMASSEKASQANPGRLGIDSAQNLGEPECT